MRDRRTMAFGSNRPMRAWRWPLIAAAAAAAAFTMSALGAPRAAQPAEGGAGGVVMGEGVPTVAALFMTSPYINSGLLALSIVAVLLFVYLALSMTSASFAPPRFVDDVTKLVLNRRFEQAIHLCQNHRHIFTSSIIQRLIENREKGPAVLMEILTAEGRRRSDRVWNRVGFLSEISTIAPMLGLLGTVIGMIKVFFTLTTRTAGQQAAELSSGIAEAMATTMFGLIVAIAAGIFYTLAKSRATGALADAEHVCQTLADHTHRAAIGAGPAPAPAASTPQPAAPAQAADGSADKPAQTPADTRPKTKPKRRRRRRGRKEHEGASVSSE